MLLSVSNLTVTHHGYFGSTRAVDDVTFDVEEGKLTALVGESGSGKSSAIRAATRMTEPSVTTVTGKAMFGDRDLLSLRLPELRRLRGPDIGFVGQNPFGFLQPTLRLRKQFHTVLRAHGRTSSRADSFSQAKKALESVGIQWADSVLDGYAHQLSGGMAQRVVIAMATVMNPRLLIADEPTTALDPTVQVQILELLHRLRDEHGVSVLIVTHDLGVVANYCDDAFVMKSGSIVERGPVAKLFTAPEHPYTQTLFADDLRGAGPR